MSEISSRSLMLIAQKHLSNTDQEWVIGQVEALNVLFDNPSWQYMADAAHTDSQVRYLVILMDLEREDRLEALSIILGCPVTSCNDAKVTRWEYSVLIDYYLNGEGKKFNETIGYTSSTAKREEKRLERETAQQAEANRQLASPVC